VPPSGGKNNSREAEKIEQKKKARGKKGPWKAKHGGNMVDQTEDTEKAKKNVHLRGRGKKR